MRGFVTVVATFALVAGEVACQRAPPVDAAIKRSLDDFSHRKTYPTLDPAILAQIPDDKLEQAVFDYAALKLKGHEEDPAATVAALPAGVRALYLTWTVEAEVNNGGFNQYYWNGGERFADEAAGSFEFFSAPRHAALMREANVVRSRESGAMSKFQERGTIEAFSESYKETRMGPLDGRFYKLDENLSALRIAKIRSEPALFSGN
jgi:hypothetical protein